MITFVKKPLVCIETLHGVDEQGRHIRYPGRAFYTNCIIKCEEDLELCRKIPFIVIDNIRLVGVIPFHKNGIEYDCYIDFFLPITTLDVDNK